MLTLHVASQTPPCFSAHSTLHSLSELILLPGIGILYSYENSMHWPATLHSLRTYITVFIRILHEASIGPRLRTRNCEQLRYLYYYTVQVFYAEKALGSTTVVVRERTPRYKYIVITSRKYILDQIRTVASHSGVSAFPAPAENDPPWQKFPSLFPDRPSLRP